MKLSDLAQAAMLGTERQTLPAVAGSSRLAALLQQLDSGEPEQSFLSAAALCSQHEAAGALPPQESSAFEPPCPAETQAHVSDAAATLIRRLLEGDHSALWPECLTLMGRFRQIVFPDVLPRLLDLGAKNSELREALRLVVGNRGIWLAAQNPSWGWVADEGLDEDAWHTGSQPARIQFLRQLRRRAPERAAPLLQSTWKDESPEDRSSFLAELAVGLGPADEPFLESALADKRKEVRQTAARLLSRLPGSAYVRRMADRVRPLLSFTAGQSGSALKLKRAQRPLLEATLPAACDAEMQRDGVEARPPAGTGEKAWWLIQMLEAAPLRTWTDAWSAAPDEIVAASNASEWKADLFEAWTRAALRQDDAAWAEALFESALHCGRPAVPSNLLLVLTPRQREAKLAALLSADDKKTRELHGQLLNQCRHDWSSDFSRAVLAYLRRESARDTYDWQTRNLLKEWAPRFSPEVFSEAASGWDTDSKGWEFWSKGVDELLAALQFRADLHRAFIPSS